MCRSSKSNTPRARSACVPFVAILMAAAGCASAGDTVSIENLDWLAGEWVGEGRDGDDGTVEGRARLHWTPVAEDSIASTFTWHSPADEHLHYAFTVFRQDGSRVIGRGIHYGRDFETFEDAPWRFEAVTMSDGVARFRCVENCRAKSVTYSLKPDGSMEARWDPMDDAAFDWVVTYRREPTVGT